MAAFSLPVLWNGLFRSCVFWLTCGAIVLLLAGAFPHLHFTVIIAVVRQAISGNLSGLSEPQFAYALAEGLFALALGLLGAFLLLHGFLVPAAVRSARVQIQKAHDRAAFAAEYESIHRRLAKHPIIGHAWKEFDETLVKRDYEPQVLRNTVRPQTFINFGIARERLLGLRIMGSIPNYFVGIGLLLTFIGLVLALSEASAAVGSETEALMQSATKRLLNVASFKFSTSIAGLGASILLSFMFRLITIRIETSFDRFCEAVEERLLYTPPQSITFEMNEALSAQLAELKQINSSEFFARLGQEIVPGLQNALSATFAPVASSIDQAVHRLADNSQAGVSDMISQFRAGMEKDAGTELRELAGVLASLRDGLVETREGMTNTGQDLESKLLSAAESFSKLVENAGNQLNQSADLTQSALNQSISALRETFAGATQRVGTELDQVVNSAALQITSQIGALLDRLQAQMEMFITAMRSSELALAGQADAVRQVNIHSRETADAFRQTADHVRSASVPLIQSGDRVASATERISEAIGSSVAALEASQTAARGLAQTLAGHTEKLSSLWSGYATQFERVDQDLARAVSTLSEATLKQGQILADYAIKVDEGFAKAITNLNPLLSTLQQNTEDLGENVTSLRDALTLRTAAE